MHEKLTFLCLSGLAWYLSTVRCRCLSYFPMPVIHRAISCLHQAGIDKHTYSNLRKYKTYGSSCYCLLVLFHQIRFKCSLSTKGSTSIKYLYSAPIWSNWVHNLYFLGTYLGRLKPALSSLTANEGLVKTAKWPGPFVLHVTAQPYAMSI